MHRNSRLALVAALALGAAALAPASDARAQSHHRRHRRGHPANDAGAGAGAGNGSGGDSSAGDNDGAAAPATETPAASGNDEGDHAEGEHRGRADRDGDGSSNGNGNGGGSGRAAAPAEPVRRSEPENPHGGQLGFFHPGRHSTGVEAEVFVFGAPARWRWAWGGFVMGPAFRFDVPFISNGPFSGVNNDLRVSAGANLMLWPGSVFYWWINVPLALQYNVFLSSSLSMFIEAGASLDLYLTEGANCYDHPVYTCDQFGVAPLVGLGARLHSSTKSGFPALTIRIEYPTGLSVGGSF